MLEEICGRRVPGPCRIALIEAPAIDARRAAQQAQGRRPMRGSRTGATAANIRQVALGDMAGFGNDAAGMRDCSPAVRPSAFLFAGFDPRSRRLIPAFPLSHRAVLTRKPWNDGWRMCRPSLRERDLADQDGFYPPYGLHSPRAGCWFRRAGYWFRDRQLGEAFHQSCAPAQCRCRPCRHIAAPPFR
jgi:hypothetical protein